MNVLVTGASGFLGRTLSAKLVRQGHTVYGLYYRVPRPLIKPEERPEPIEFYDPPVNSWPIAASPSGKYIPVQGNVTDFSQMLELLVDCQIEHIFHLAAKSIVRDCRLYPVDCIRTNVLGTVAVLEAARQAECVKGIALAASDKCYGPGPVPYQETQAMEPAAIYEASKACVVHLMTSYWQGYGVPSFVIAAANCYGQDHNRSRLVPNTILRLLDGKKPQITAGAESYRREFVHVSDVVSAYVKLMEVERWGEVFNVGSGECHTVREAVQLICEVFGEPDIGFDEWEKPETLTEIPDQYLCLDKLREVWPEYKPRTMRESLPEVIEWYRKNR